MAKTPSTERFVVRLLPVEVGFYLLRYIDANDKRRPPRVFVSRKPGSKSDIGFLHSAGVKDELLQPGDAVAICCREPTDLMITTCSDALSVSDDVELKFDRLDDFAESLRAGAVGQARAGSSAMRNGRTPAFTLDDLDDVLADDDAEEPVAASARPAPSGRGRQARESEAEVSHFGVTGHVQAVGDTEAGPDGWLGAERGRRWIEGFAVAWERSVPGLKLSYAADILGRGRTKTCLAGQYAGTRRQAVPVVGVSFELSGAQAPGYELVVQASFLDGGIEEASGRSIELSGPTGEEPLTGLRIALQRAAAATGRGAGASRASGAERAGAGAAGGGRAQAKAQPQAQAGSRGRIRVFRSQEKI